jgi:CheY-like chemotaxis protein
LGSGAESGMNEVLLAEDEPVSRRFLVDALGALGFDCTAAIDGSDARVLAFEHRFDLLLLDVNLPLLDGPALLAQLRGDRRAASHAAPAIALTADPDRVTHRQLQRRGFAAVGRKPIALEQLATLLDLARSDDGGERIPPPRWDDAAALSATGGQREAVDALRALMLRELPGQRVRIIAALDVGNADAARAELHRLRAACGFCGAAALSAAVDALSARLAFGRTDAVGLARFFAAAQELEREARGDPPTREHRGRAP